MPEEREPRLLLILIAGIILGFVAGMVLWLTVAPIPSDAQGVGVFTTSSTGSRTNCSAITDPVIGQTICFDQSANAWKFYTGASTSAARWMSSTATQTGVNNVRDFGAVGDGSTDDTAAFTAAIATGVPRIIVPPGTYRITSTLTLTTAQTISGVGLPGSAINGLASILKHDFSGTFINFTGTSGSNDPGSGGGLESLQLLQSSGTGTGAAGTAVKLTAASSTFFPARVRIDAVQIETGNGADSFTYGIYAAGIPDTTHGITDLYVSRSRIVGDTFSTAAILLENGRNVHIYETQLTGTNGHLQITGGAGANEQSSAIYITSVSGAQLQLDQATNVTVIGGAYTAITTTANTTKALVIAEVTNATPTILGTGNTIIVQNTATGRYETYSTATPSMNNLRVASGLYLNSTQTLWNGASDLSTPRCIDGCGTSPTVVGTNSAMRITMSSTGNLKNPFTIVFNGSWNSIPSCVTQLHTATNSTVTVTNVTTTGAQVNTWISPAQGVVYNMHCLGVG